MAPGAPLKFLSRSMTGSHIDLSDILIVLKDVKGIENVFPEARVEPSLVTDHSHCVL